MPWRRVRTIIRHRPCTSITFCNSQRIGICTIILSHGISKPVSACTTLIIRRQRRYGIYRQNGQHHTEGQYHAEQSFFHKNPPLRIVPNYSSLHPPQTQKAPHRLKGWCDALRKLLGSAAGCHITGPVALRRSLSAGLPILLFLCGILHKNHRTFFFFLSITQNHLWRVAQKRKYLYGIFG